MLVFGSQILISRYFPEAKPVMDRFRIVHKFLPDPDATLLPLLVEPEKL